MSKYKEKWRFQFPKFASYEDTDEIREIYKNLKTNKASFFYNQEYTQIFIAAMALAYIRGAPPKPITKRSQSIPTSVFTSEERWMMIAVALASPSQKEKDIAILKNEKEILRIAEEYANAGLKYLNMIYEDGILTDPIETLEKELRKYLEKI